MRVPPLGVVAFHVPTLTLRPSFALRLGNANRKPIMALPISELPDDERQQAETAVRAAMPNFRFVTEEQTQAARGGPADIPAADQFVGFAGAADGGQTPLDVSLGIDLDALKAAYRRTAQGAAASGDAPQIVGAGLPDAASPAAAAQDAVRGAAVETRVGLVEPVGVPRHDPATMRKAIVLDGDNNIVGIQG